MPVSTGAMDVLWSVSSIALIYGLHFVNQSSISHPFIIIFYSEILSIYS